MIQPETAVPIVLSAVGIALFAVVLYHLRSTVGSVPSPPTSDGTEHYYCLECHTDFDERNAAVDHARGRTGHDVRLLRTPTP